MTGVLVIGEMAGNAVTKQTLETVAAALQLSVELKQPVSGALFGAGDLAGAAAQFNCGFSTLLLVESERLEQYSAQQSVTAALAVIAKLQPSVLLLPHSARTRDWAPQLAAKLGSGLVLDCVNVVVGEDGLAAVKPMYGGGVWGQHVVHGEPAIITVRAGVFDCAKPDAGASIERLEVPNLAPNPRIEHLETIVNEGTDGQQLKDAKTIISGGRGTGGQENWHLIEEAAAATGGAIGCSRAIVDMGWLRWNHQVGLSGTIVAPELYIAVGISGAVQHLAGISNAKTVVAINNDPDAEIFKRADYGVIGDFKEVLPAFIEHVKGYAK